MTHRFVAAAAIVTLIGGCEKQAAARPVFPLDHCARVTLIDRATGAVVIGAEDLDIDRAGGRIFVSAYDRRRVEKAAASRSRSIPEGGMYAISVFSQASGEASVDARPLLDPGLIGGGLRPHGVSFNSDRGVLAFINRSYLREGRAWRMRPAVVVIDPAAGKPISRTSVECPANDLARNEGRWLVTLDHSACGWRAAVEDVFGARSGRVVDEHGGALVAGVGYANGAVTTPDGDLVVAATRERVVHVVPAAQGDPTSTPTIKLKAAPDNLTLADNGRVIAAVHPRLLAIGMQRRLGIGRSPSRVIEIDHKSGEQRLLFDDPKAELLSAATAAVLTQDILVIGSVADAGLVVCRQEAARE